MSNLSHYFRRDNMPKNAAAMLAKQDIEDLPWMFGHRFVDRTTATLWPQLLDLVDSINSVPDAQTKQLYAETAARIIAGTMIGVSSAAIREQEERLVEHVQTAHSTAASIISKVARKKKDSPISLNHHKVTPRFLQRTANNCGRALI